jgi:NADH:ubiquinone oxidoreductase subunit 2 (subunit N)
MILLALVRFFLIRRSTLVSTLVFSSIAHTLWILTRTQIRKAFLISYWLRYTSVLILLLRESSNKGLKETELKERVLIRISWLLLRGIPPFLFFWIKAHIIYRLLFNIRIIFILLILVTRVISLRAYYRSWYFNSLLNAPYVLKKQKLFWVWIFVFCFWILK